MKDAIIGYDTYVGGYIRENLDPNTTEYYNELNFDKISGKYSRVFVCCVPISQWDANKNPYRDGRIINDIFNLVKSIDCENIILFSTIEVHTRTSINNEKVNDVSVDTFGRNRFKLEQDLRFIFDNKLLIVRLPETFGIDVNYNVLSELMKGKNVNSINMNSAYQWYPMAWLYQDMITAFQSDLKVINLYPEAIETSDIICEIFPKYKGKGYYGRRVHSRHTSMHENKYMFSPKSILSVMKDFVIMNEYKNSPNKMVVSNLAWESYHDKHAIFLMKRYGISKVEISPTRYATWKENFENPSFHKEYIKNKIEVYSIQSVLNGVNGDFEENPMSICNHLDNVTNLCEKVGGKIIIIDCADKRNTNGRNLCEKNLSDVLNSVQKKNKRVKICLQPISKEYGCKVGINIEECNKIIGGNSFYMNFDTGNYLMERDESFHLKMKNIKHCSLSCSFQRPIHHITYERFKRRDINDCLSKAHKDSSISLRIRCQDITNLGEHFRRFSTFMAGL